MNKQEIITALQELSLKYKDAQKTFKQNIPIIHDMIARIEDFDDSDQAAMDYFVKKEIIGEIIKFETNDEEKIAELRRLIDKIINPKEDLYNIIYNALKKLQLHRVKSDFLTRISKDGQQSNQEKIDQILQFIEKCKGSLDSHVCKVHIVKLLLDLVTNSESKKAIIEELVGKFNLPQRVKEEIQKEIEKTKDTTPLRQKDGVKVKSDKPTDEYINDWTREIEGLGGLKPDTQVYFNGEKIEKLAALKQKLKEFLRIPERQDETTLDNLVAQILKKLKGVNLMLDKSKPERIISQSNFQHNSRCYFQFDEQTGNIFFKREFNGYLGKHSSKERVSGKFESNVFFNIRDTPITMSICSQLFVDPKIGQADEQYMEKREAAHNKERAQSSNSSSTHRRT